MKSLICKFSKQKHMIHLPVNLYEFKFGNSAFTYVFEGTVVNKSIVF